MNTVESGGTRGSIAAEAGIRLEAARPLEWAKGTPGAGPGPARRANTHNRPEVGGELKV
ncbi:hypothetical protein GCM10027449_25880 [Sinomonas notoginsengisoli]